VASLQKGEGTGTLPWLKMKCETNKKHNSLLFQHGLWNWYFGVSRDYCPCRCLYGKDRVMA